MLSRHGRTLYTQDFRELHLNSHKGTDLPRHFSDSFHEQTVRTTSPFTKAQFKRALCSAGVRAQPDPFRQSTAAGNFVKAFEQVISIAYTAQLPHTITFAWVSSYQLLPPWHLPWFRYHTECCTTLSWNCRLSQVGL